MGGANGSRERAPDDKLRDTHHLLNDGDGFREGLNSSYKSADLPDGQITDLAVQPLREKYSASRSTQIKSIYPAILSRERGVSRSSRTLGRDVVDAAASGALVKQRADE